MRKFISGVFILSASILANAADVLQINGTLIINDSEEFTNAPFVVLEDETSTLEEEGLGGYRVELSASSNIDESYTVYSKIYTYTQEGFTLLGGPSIKLEINNPGKIHFESEKAGPVQLALEIVRKEELTEDISDFGQPVR